MEHRRKEEKGQLARDGQNTGSSLCDQQTLPKDDLCPQRNASSPISVSASSTIYDALRLQTDSVTPNDYIRIPHNLNILSTPPTTLYQDLQWTVNDAATYNLDAASLGEFPQDGSDLAILEHRSQQSTYAGCAGITANPETAFSHELLTSHTTCEYIPPSEPEIIGLPVSTSLTSSLDGPYCFHAPADGVQLVPLNHPFESELPTSEIVWTPTLPPGASIQPTGNDLEFEQLFVPDMPASIEWESVLASVFAPPIAAHPPYSEDGAPLVAQLHSLKSNAQTSPTVISTLQHRLAYMPSNFIHGGQLSRSVQDAGYNTLTESAAILSSYVRSTIAGQSRIELANEPYNMPEMDYSQQGANQGTHFQFEQETLHGKSQKKNKRRPFDQEGREKVKQVRQMKACIRCRMNKRSCSTDDPCKGCVSLAKRIKADSSLLKHICFRHSLFDLRFNQAEMAMPTWDQYIVAGKHVEEAYQGLELEVVTMSKVFRKAIMTGEMADDGIEHIDAIIPKQISGRLKKGRKLPQYLEYWQGVCLDVWQRKRRDLSEEFSVEEFFRLIHKLQYSQSLEEMDKLEMRFAEAFVVFLAIHFVIKYTAVDPSRRLPPGHSMFSYVAAIDFMEGLLIRETDRMLNRVSQYPKKKIDGLLAVLETWEVRFSFGAAWRAAASNQNLDGFSPTGINAIKGLEASINGLRMALLGRI